jgi:hypothetical protein
MGHSTSKTHQNSSISSFSLSALLHASIDRCTSVSGTAPELVAATRISTAATARTEGSFFRAFRYSGSVRSPSQNTSKVFLTGLVATFRRRGRPLGFLEITIRCLPRDRERDVALSGPVQELRQTSLGGRTFSPPNSARAVRLVVPFPPFSVSQTSSRLRKLSRLVS